MGLGDRLGLATPGHIRAIRGTGVKPVLAQQSIREMTRSNRTPEQVMEDALWGVFEEGFRDGFGADADHLKSTADVDATLAAGFRTFTIDPGEHVDNAAGHEGVPALLGKLPGIPWEQLQTTEADCRRAFLGRSHRVDYDMELAFTEETLLRALVKYGRAVAHTARLHRHLAQAFSGRAPLPRNGAAFELEMSVDETDSPTTSHEHFYIAHELKRLGVPVVSLAPRFIGDFEKGIDYKGDLRAFEAAFIQHVKIARCLGPYKISIHSGSDKFSIYPIAAKHARGTRPPEDRRHQLPRSAPRRRPGGPAALPRDSRLRHRAVRRGQSLLPRLGRPFRPPRAGQAQGRPACRRARRQRRPPGPARDFRLRPHREGRLRRLPLPQPAPPDLDGERGPPPRHRCPASEAAHRTLCRSGMTSVRGEFDNLGAPGGTGDNTSPELRTAALGRVCAGLRKVLLSREVLADEKPVAVSPAEEDVREALLPLLAWCRRREPCEGSCRVPCEGSYQPSQGSPPQRSPITPGQRFSRGLVGIAGPPGSGKSLLAAWLAAAAKALGWEEFAFFSLDGYHLPNAVLENRMGADADGNPVSLRKLKGTPQTFDAARLLADLRALKHVPRSGGDRRERRLPGYSRVLHEPAPDRIRISPDARWVLVEGNFLFLDVPPWREMRELFDRKVYLDAEDEVLAARLARRHAAAGRDAEWIQEHFRRTDGPNIRLSRASARFADIAFRWDHRGRLVEMKPKPRERSDPR